MPDVPRDGSEDLPGLEGLDLTEVDYENWSDSDWAGWFRDEVMETNRWRSLDASFNTDEGTFEMRWSTGRRPLEAFALDPKTGDVDRPLMDATLSLAGTRATNDDYVALPFGHEEWDRAFGRLSDGEKMRFIGGWYRVHGPGDAQPADPPTDDAVPTDDAAADSAEPMADDWDVDPTVNITLPRGNVVTVPVAPIEKPKSKVRTTMIGGGLVAGALVIGAVSIFGGDDGALDDVEAPAPVVVSPSTVPGTSNGSSPDSTEGSPPSLRDVPVAINACDYVEADDVTDFAGNAVTAGAVDGSEGLRQVCVFPAADDASFFLSVDVLGPVAADAYDLSEFRRIHPGDLAVIENLGFGHDGELRADEQIVGYVDGAGDVVEYPHAETHLQVHYLNSDESLLMSIQVHHESDPQRNPSVEPPSLESQQATVIGVAEMVWDAMIAAQGE